MVDKMPSDDSDKPQVSSSRKRAKHTRSKRGCRVCRIRRIRCDLTRPACNRCTSTGRNCEGYPIDVSPSEQIGIPSRSIAPRLVMLAPRSIPPISEDEQLHFSYFRHHTARQFGGYFEDDSWSQLVLQMAMSEIAILQITIALGLLHEKFDHAHDFDKSTRTLYGFEPVTQPYNKAIQHLQSHLNAKGWAKLEVTLVACILCIGFDWLRGDAISASIHLRSGLNILKHWYSNCNSMPDSPALTSPTAYIIQSKIVPFYSRLVLQSASLFDFSLQWSLLPTVQIFDQFTSLEHARDCLVDLIGRMQLIPETRALLKKKNSESDQEHQHFDRQLVRWQSRFDDLVHRSNQENLAMSLKPSFHLVKILHLLASIMLRNIYTDTEINGENTEVFKQVLDRADKILESNLPRFTVDFGLVAVVYYVAIHCPEPTIYQRALKILESRMLYEGYWNSADAHRVALRKIQQRSANGTLNLHFDP